MNIDKIDLFSTPIFVYDIEENVLSEIQREVSEKLPIILKEENFYNPWDDNILTSFKRDSTENQKYFLQKYEMKKLISIIEKSALTILKNYNQSVENIKFKDSWINISRKNCFQFEHNHNDCILSGVYYFKTNEKDGNIVFLNPNPLKHYENLFFPHNENFFSVTPKVGRLILFPGWLNHKVLVNNTDNERISITFNIKNN